MKVTAYPSDERTIRAMTGVIGSKGDPCRAYHQGFRWYMRSSRAESKERWLRILTKLKSQFPAGGCDHVVTG